MLKVAIFVISAPERRVPNDVRISADSESALLKPALDGSAKGSGVGTFARTYVGAARGQITIEAFRRVGRVALTCSLA